MKKEVVEQECVKTSVTDAVEVVERFMETRESYVRALETAVQALKNKIDFHEKTESTIKQSIDELLAVQRLGNIISTSSDSVSVFDSLLDLTRQVIPVEESMIFEVGNSRSRVNPFLQICTEYMMKSCQHLLEEGILDWVIEQKKTTVVPDLNSSVGEIGERNFVVVPLVLRSEAIGVYVIHTERVSKALSEHDLALLGVLANQAAVAIENLRNVEKLRNAADELKKSQSQMVHAAKLASLGELAGGVAHEINNPLQILLGHVALLSQGKDVEHRIEIIRNQVQRIAQITRQLVSFSRSVPDELDHEPLNVNWAIDEIIALVDYQFKNRGIEFDLRYSDDLPPLDSNKNYLQQGFLNLLLNAKDAMPNGGKMLISTEYHDGKIFIRFSDTGVGIKKENMAKIFEPFFTTKEPGKGTGLGLSITRGIIRKLSGEIKVDSVEGRGTTFTIFIPVKKSLETTNGGNR
ncbi:MAG TPA: ATP-binding protein [Candidatus Acidoferrales bacterium]|nr:ATP-binding protein [Candidatus Acidoferrales bacterium]